MSTVTIRPIDSNEDVLSVIYLAEQFHAELQWPYTFSIERSAQRIQGYRHNPDTDLLVAEIDGRIVAGAEVAFDYEYSIERVGYLSKFYVSPEGRRTTVGVRLIRACNEWFDDKGCVNSFATATANIPELGKAFDNLLVRNGWEVCANTLVRSRDVKSKEGR